MPISNGFEACKNILKIYNKNSLLKIDKKPADNDDSEIKSSASLSFSNTMDLKPLMIACSSEVLTPELQKQLDEAGFDHFYQVPLKSSEIKDEIIPALHERKERIQKIQEMNKIKECF